MGTRTRKRGAAASGRKAAPRGAQQSPEAVELRRLIESVIDAKRRGDDDARDEATQALIDFRTRPVSAELRRVAEEARVAADNEVMADSLKALSEIAARMSAAAPALDAATAIAAGGVKGLIVPRLASSAASILKVVEELQQSIEAAKAQVGSVKELGDVPKLLSDLKASVDKLKARAKALQG
ncbi:MAG: hypothetical protein OEZ09_00335 [Betaproteobacteria bacterium]|nr:hypothetical protein [Betaproteobacteria bacterium]MDH4323665.1 hypothetical protein [Betaproteobacteria bacterium]MDH5211565.1 hypothetical protein [Betaproteobacteria bacterium]MDH5576882.1 hypothetical protein [Betaproteobacteria bacterium]